MIVSVKNLTHKYDKFSFLNGSSYECVLNDINLEIKKGQALGLMGLSGSGKSTLANIIMGLIKPTKGEIKFDGKCLNLGTLSQRREFYKNAQMVFQDPVGSTNPAFSVREVINEPLKYLGEKNANALIEEVCDTLQIKKQYLDKKALSLSGGELGRVALARAIIIKPKFLILDEALSSFDLVLQDDIIKFLNTLKGQMSFLFVTHDLRLARAFCDEIVLMDKGVIIEKIAQNEKFNSEFGKKLERFSL